MPVSAYYLGPARRNGLYLGFSAIPEARIIKAAKRLNEVFSNANVKSRL